MADKQADKPEPEVGDGQGDDDGEIGLDELRQIVRDEIRSLIPGLGSSSDAGGPDPAAGAGDGDAPLSLRQITERALHVTAKALDKIPGGTATKTTEPAAAAPEKAPVSRAIKFLGFADE